MPKLILLLYFLTFIAHFCSSTNAIAVGIRVGVRVKVEVEVEVKVEVEVRVEVKVEVKVEAEGCIYVLYSLRAYRVFLVRLLFSQRSIILAVKPVQILLSLREIIIFSK